MKTLLLLVFTVCCLGSRAQSVFPTFEDHPRWNVSQWFWEDYELVQYNFESDTAICGFNYSKVNSYYLRSEGKKVFIRQGVECADPEFVLYDFDVVAGDTFWLYQFEFDSVQFSVEAVDSVVYFGVKRRRIQLHYDPCGLPLAAFHTTEWIEGIGSTDHPFYSTYCFCDACESGASLMCYDSSGIQLYGAASEFACDIIVPIENYSIEAIEIFPNPARDKIQINGIGNDYSFYSVYGISGIKYFSGDLENNQPVDIDQLKPGLYYIQIFDRDMKLVDMISFVKI